MKDTTYIVILNCNKYMFDILQDRKLEDNIHINPEIIQKNRDHGSLTYGFVSNMKYAYNILSLATF